MYTMLPHEKLLRRLEDAVSEAWRFTEKQAGCQTGLGREEAEYGTCDLQPRRSDATLEVFGENNYVCNTIRWLKKKITMGLAVSPQLANLCCHTVERDFVLAPKRTDEAAFRWIDDILTFGSIPSEERTNVNRTVVARGRPLRSNSMTLFLGQFWAKMM